MFLISGYSNATNLTDGLDGLAGWVFVTSALPFFAFWQTIIIN